MPDSMQDIKTLSCEVRQEVLKKDLSISRVFYD